MSSNRHLNAASATRAIVNPAIVTKWFPLPRGLAFARHSHPDHQLAWASEGVVTVAIDDRTWVLPRSRALWIPAETPHTTTAASRSLLGGIYFPPSTCPIPWTEPTVVAVTDLLAELLVHLTNDTAAPRARDRAEAVVFDLLEPIAITTLHLPRPIDDRAARVADVLVHNPSDERTLADWGQLVGASDRTLARAFVADTGLTFSAWRTQLRLGAALPLLADGVSVANAARAVGYANPSAFIVAFRRVLGTSPGAYFNRDHAYTDE